MAYNNNFNNNFPYGNIYQPYIPQPQMNYGNPGMVNNQQSQQQPQMQNVIPQQQTAYLPLTFTSGLVGAKSFIVAPNQTVYLRDSDEGSDLLFQKSADMYGKYTIKAYHLTEVNLDDIGKPVKEASKPEFMTKSDFNDLRTYLDNKINDLSYLIQNRSKAPKNNPNLKAGENNE